MLGTIDPVMNAGMGHVAVAELAAAVLSGRRTRSPGDLHPAHRTDVRCWPAQRIPGPTEAPFGANVTLGFPNAGENAAVLLGERVPVINLSLGIDADLVDSVHAYGGKVISTVTTRRHVHSAAGHGVDAVIVTGAERRDTEVRYRVWCSSH